MTVENAEDKISPVYADMFKRMLGIKGELPDKLLQRYFLIKRMTDKVDARLTAADLARIALDCGFNPETGKFKGEKEDKKEDGKKNDKKNDDESEV